MNKMWVIESKPFSKGSYSPVAMELSRDGARALQRYMKATGKLKTRSRIRAYEMNPNTRG
jgi:hypothetical protein